MSFTELLKAKKYDTSRPRTDAQGRVWVFSQETKRWRLKDSKVQPKGKKKTPAPGEAPATPKAKAKKKAVADKPPTELKPKAKKKAAPKAEAPVKSEPKSESKPAPKAKPEPSQYPAGLQHKGKGGPGKESTAKKVLGKLEQLKNTVKNAPKPNVKDLPIGNKAKEKLRGMNATYQNMRQRMLGKSASFTIGGHAYGTVADENGISLIRL